MIFNYSRPSSITNLDVGCKLEIRHQGRIIFNFHKSRDCFRFRDERQTGSDDDDYTVCIDMERSVLLTLTIKLNRIFNRFAWTANKKENA